MVVMAIISVLVTSGQRGAGVGVIMVLPGASVCIGVMMNSVCVAGGILTWYLPGGREACGGQFNSGWTRLKPFSLPLLQPCGWQGFGHCLAT